MSKIPGVNSNINDTPQSPWYKTKWSHLLSSGMQLRSESFSHIENGEPQKRFGESFMEIKAKFFVESSIFNMRKAFTACSCIPLLKNGSISFCTKGFGECH